MNGNGNTSNNDAACAAGDKRAQRELLKNKEKKIIAENPGFSGMLSATGSSGTNGSLNNTKNSHSHPNLSKLNLPPAHNTISNS